MEYKRVIVFVIAILTATAAFCQNTKMGKFNTHDIRIYYSVEDSGATAKGLFVTTDGGKSWKNAESIGKVKWETDGKGANVIFTVPSDGVYGFAFCFGDNPTAIESPKSGEAPELSALVDTIPPVATIKNAEQVSNGKEIRIYFDASDANGVAEVRLWATNDGGKLWHLAQSSKVFEDENGKFIIFIAADYGGYGFICQAIDVVGNKSCADPQAQAKPDMEITITAYENSKPDIASAKEHYQRGVLLAACGKTAQAANEFEKAIGSWSNYKDALNSIAYIYYEKGEYNRALEYFIRARKSDPSDPVSHINTALACLKLNLNQDALQELRDGIELGLDRKDQKFEEAEITAGEILCQITKEALEAKDEKTAIESSNLILKMPLSTPQAKGYASSIAEAYKKAKS